MEVWHLGQALVLATSQLYVSLSSRHLTSHLARESQLRAQCDARRESKRRKRLRWGAAPSGLLDGGREDGLGGQEAAAAGEHATRAPRRLVVLMHALEAEAVLARALRREEAGLALDSVGAVGSGAPLEQRLVVHVRARQVGRLRIAREHLAVRHERAHKGLPDDQLALGLGAAREVALVALIIDLVGQKGAIALIAERVPALKRGVARLRVVANGARDGRQRRGLARHATHEDRRAAVEVNDGVIRSSGRYDARLGRHRLLVCHVGCSGARERAVREQTVGKEMQARAGAAGPRLEESRPTRRARRRWRARVQARDARAVRMAERCFAARSFGMVGMKMRISPHHGVAGAWAGVLVTWRAHPRRACPDPICTGEGAPAPPAYRSRAAPLHP